MIVTYLLPTVWAGKVPMQYRIEKRKKDMRTRFCRDNEFFEIGKGWLNRMLDFYECRIMVKDDRILVANGKDASMFFNDVYRLFDITRMLQAKSAGII